MSRNSGMMKGVSLGMMAGIAVGMIGGKMMSTKKRTMKKTADKAIHTVENIIDAAQYMMK